jgi:hypothetical protein
MAYDLEDVDVLELSLVDVPANQHSAVVLFKRVATESLSGYEKSVNPQFGDRHNEGDGSVTVEELTKKLEGLQAQVTDLTKAAADAKAAEDAAKADLAALIKSAEAAEVDVQDGKLVKRADPEYVEIDGEKIEKALVPAPLLKALEKQAAEIAKMQAKAQEVELAKRGDAELPNLAGTGLAKGRLLKAVEGDADLLKALKAADAAMANAYVEKGSAALDENSPEAKLDALAKAHADAHKVGYHAAYAEVTKSGVGAELLAQMRATAN